MNRAMTKRSTTRTVRFRHPFMIEGIDGPQAAGSYVIEIEEELLQGLSFPAWRRLHTAIRLPQKSGVSLAEQVVTVDPRVLDAALANDAAD